MLRLLSVRCSKPHISRWTNLKHCDLQNCSWSLHSFVLLKRKKGIYRIRRYICRPYAPLLESAILWNWVCFVLDTKPNDDAFTMLSSDDEEVCKVCQDLSCCYGKWTTTNYHGWDLIWEGGCFIPFCNKHTPLCTSRTLKDNWFESQNWPNPSPSSHHVVVSFQNQFLGLHYNHLCPWSLPCFWALLGAGGWCMHSSMCNPWSAIPYCWCPSCYWVCLQNWLQCYMGMIRFIPATMQKVSIIFCFCICLTVQLC